MRKLNTFRTNSSGQLLIVAALIIALMISSTTIYVYELNKGAGYSNSPTFTDFALSLKQSTRNVMIGALANASNGGYRTVLSENLNHFSDLVRRLNQFGVCNLTCSLFEDSVYDLGIWFSWNSSDIDVSGAYADFGLIIDGFASRVSVPYAINATTSLASNCSYVLEGTEKHVNVTCRLYNKEEPALAKSIVVSYESAGNWIQISGTTIDYDNGTYLISITVPSDAAQVLLNVWDSRDIFVQAKHAL